MNTTRTINTTKTQTTVALGAAAALLLGFAMIAPAGAATSDEVPSLVVHYDPQSLATDDGARVVYEKIASAARQVCAEGPSHDLKAFAAAYHCRKAAIARAVSEIHQPRLVEIAAVRAKRG